MFYFKDYVQDLLARLLTRHGISGSFLEIGCGRGHNLRFLSERGLSGLGIDISDEALSCARAMVEDLPDVQVARSDLFAVTGTFDIVVCLCVLEHIEDDGAALDKIRSLLSTERSHLILGVPAGPYMGDDLLFGHYRRYTKSELLQRIRSRGYLVHECVALGFPLLYCTRILINRLRRSAGSVNAETFRRNTLASDLAHPYQHSPPGRVLEGALGFAPGRWLIYVLLRLQELFANGSTAHTFIVVASRDPKADAARHSKQPRLNARDSGSTDLD